jgi:hypothetical protein
MSHNNNIRKITGAQDSVPAASSGSGTITSVNNSQIEGAGTAFLTEAQIGDYIYIKAQNEFRRINTITSDTQLYIDSPFTVPLAAAVYHITPQSKFVEIAWIVSGLADAIVDGVTVPPGTNNDFSKASKGPSGGAGNKYIDPIDIDATGTEVTVTTLA